ncbi:hypothetical protein OQA88_5598 [Cercophora sp. LCS_1]
MASPPYNQPSAAHSPPHLSHTQLPPINTMTGKKRGAEGGSTPALKRRKPSTMSISSAAGSAHPLRQTSFPPDEIGTPLDARSPSMDLDSMSLVGSQVSAAAPPKKKRGRKSKAEKAREQTPSVAGGKAPTAVSGVSDGGGRGAKSAAGAPGNEEGEGDDDGPTEVAATTSTMTKEQKEEEHRLRGMLINALSPEQFDRFENWRASNFSKAGVRRLVNATISQSVTENVVIGMRAVAKLHAGDIVEAARKVRAEWCAKTGEKQTDLPTPPGSAGTSPDPDDPLAQIAKKFEEDRMGPLRPEHLREAVRRYKMSYEGGGVGVQATWNRQQHNGVDRFPPRTGGRRIFL